MGEEAELAGRIALVTGAARGIGREIATVLALNGAHVVVADILEDDGVQAIAEMKQAGLDAQFVRLDVTEPGDWATLRDMIQERFGRLDILVNNAAFNMRESIAATSVEHWKRTLDVNLFGAFCGMQTLLPLMQTGDAAIVNISSTSGIFGQPDAAYSASKWALRGLTKTAAIEFASMGIRCNSVHPGTVPSPMHVNAPPGHGEVWKRIIPMKRPGKMREIAEAALFLASPRSSYITGTEIIVDGGLSQGGIATARATMLEDWRQAHPSA
ncbi:SDR family NAD(P)-dependent oxidoreductase [Sphingobium subterraneum]|uniref:NAD(P)-dependent dehydrogenase (Short-subunit alcohol dehydrogenase family) n=1 Tax=Sphingobium subterraneum TaxID=627688 RepID=A0A841IXE7_9SPHN|nr:SDR family oxidoreductase [Sphingobium subterraneum]MBB6122960.1 NAD(P)-dependent dehydrogenase (short-subunit alcohol dehydrogenase family) [Sphingobium subterraneum]